MRQKTIIGLVDTCVDADCGQQASDCHQRDGVSIGDVLIVIDSFANKPDNMIRSLNMLRTRRLLQNAANLSKWPFDRYASSLVSSIDTNSPVFKVFRILIFIFLILLYNRSIEYAG